MQYRKADGYMLKPEADDSGTASSSTAPGAAAEQEQFGETRGDGLVVRVQETQDRREALEAVGLSEQGAHAES